ncbi:uncharacterized protein [Capricornis sumatraensis]|uniref:uncharacterized protein n=1 Tax=Capricornis sumatraensis TaxID=34865 RepID=UPI00360536FD
MARAAAAARCPGSRPASGRVPRAPRRSPSASLPPPPRAFRSRGARPRPPARLALAPRGCLTRPPPPPPPPAGPPPPRPPPPPRGAPGSVPRGEGGGAGGGEVSSEPARVGPSKLRGGVRGHPPLPPL